MTFRLSAGVYPYEYVKGTAPFNPVNMTIGASVFASKKGPIGPHLITGGWEEFVKIYGNPDMQWSPAHLALKPALKEMRVFYGNRVVNDAKFAGLSLFYDDVNKNFFSLPFETGSSQDYSNALKISKVLTFSDAIPNGKTISVDLGSENITQVFNQTSNYTLQLLATQIQSKLDELGTGGSAKVIKAWNLSDRRREDTIVFSRDFVQTETASIKIKGEPGIAETTVSATFDGTTITTSDGVRDALIAAINEIDGLTAIALPGEVPGILISCSNAGPVDLTITKVALPETMEMIVTNIKEGHGVYDDRSIVITLPETLDSLEISGSIAESTVTVTVQENAKVLDIYAQNPGAWASNSEEGLGIKITNIDNGINQRIRLSISQAIAEGNTFEGVLSVGSNSWNCAPVDFATSSDNTLKLIAESIQACMDENIGVGGSATVEEVTGGVENDRNILIIAPNASIKMEVTDAQFTGGTTQPVVTISQIIPNTPSKEIFTLSVYSRESINLPIESWEVSFKKQLDANGNQMFIEDRINSGAYESENIRVVSYTNDFSKLAELNTIQWLGGGDDGYLPTTGQIVEGWNEFEDPEKITVRILINAGYASPVIHQTMAAIAKRRRDCVALLDMPSQSQSTQAAMNYRQYEMNVNTSYAALYSPDILVFDEVSGMDAYIAPSGYAAAQICFTERTRAIYWAPAGLNRGICDGAKGVRYKYGEGDRDLLEPLQINPIRDMGTNGIAIFGEYTTQTAADPLRDLHVRLMCNNIEIAMTDALAYKLFEPNDEYIRSVMALEADAYLKPIQDGRGLRDYRVVSDITKENPAEVDAGVGVLSIYLKPVSSLKFIRLNSYILGSGVEFEEVIENGV